MNRLTLGPDTPPGFYWRRVGNVWDVCQVVSEHVLYLGIGHLDPRERAERMKTELWGPIEPPSVPEGFYHRLEPRPVDMSPGGPNSALVAALNAAGYVEGKDYVVDPDQTLRIHFDGTERRVPPGVEP